MTCFVSCCLLARRWSSVSASQSLIVLSADELAIVSPSLFQTNLSQVREGVATDVSKDGREITHQGPAAHGYSTPLKSRSEAEEALRKTQCDSNSASLLQRAPEHRFVPRGAQGYAAPCAAKYCCSLSTYGHSKETAERHYDRVTEDDFFDALSAVGQFQVQLLPDN